VAGAAAAARRQALRDQAAAARRHRRIAAAATRPLLLGGSAASQQRRCPLRVERALPLPSADALHHPRALDRPAPKRIGISDNPLHFT